MADELHRDPEPDSGIELSGSILEELEVPSGVVALDGAATEDDPQRFGPYQLIAEIARGGMGVVYLCRRGGEAGFQRLFALKVMHEHLARDFEFVTMLLDEGRLAARIHHHNVVSVVDLGVNERGYYLVMDYIEGCSLAELLARHRAHRPPELIVPILIGALNGLHAAHTLEDDEGRPLELAHRDVSPQNILIGVDGDARIVDFGVAKAKARITSTRPGFLKGKLAYAAPELLQNGTEGDRRVDIFAAGAVMWSALTGQPLFRGSSQAELIGKLMHMDIPPPSTVGLQPPGCLDEICLKALARDADQRFQSAADMADALRDAAVHHNMLGAPTRVARWVRDTFAEELATRRRIIRDAVSGRGAAASGLPALPGLSADPEGRATPATPVGRAAATTPGADADDAEPGTADEAWPESGPPLPAWGLLLAMMVAFAAGCLLVLYLRG